MLGISNEEAGAFGDQMNDYEMLQTVKYGYAMANAMPPVKEVAYQVIDSNENDGVILKIKEILKGKCKDHVFNQDSVGRITGRIFES